MVISSINLEDGNKYVLSANQNELILPSVFIQQNLQNELDKLFETYTNFNAGWTNIKLIKAEIIDNKLNMYYLTKIPFESIINGFWIKGITASIIDHNVHDCIIYV